MKNDYDEKFDSLQESINRLTNECKRMNNEKEDHIWNWNEDQLLTQEERRALINCPKYFLTVEAGRIFKESDDYNTKLDALKLIDKVTNGQ